ncbi:FadR/GntR family transcriptional regulator [Nonomuraea muscovyensis]|jgi:DNA-binding FadR family transcriptional regulator|uniref:DNA-binding FadR family transcriptional regulator n=1 Tax=Nonomuraea muscovyensis TaxID=1124761 RepID=A0A7X0F306_9ACTN|nr:FadR/GntR family transcriptional regulator [Nonomuraea muscovyensis]MBB6352174.1 DNA-binding FadR family transcriptional regulator [Nonomuraea muscovyensis]MDF2709378.1 GntR family transcriptional regulator [Nonomuraea muscovyensis]
MGGPRFEPVRTVRAYERIVEQIEEAIESGALGPGRRLPSERDLMGQFSVSRSTVREALRVLQARGLVRSRPGDPNGAEVLPFTPAALHKSMTTLARVQGLSLAELVQFRMVLDSSANLLAARLRTDEQLAEMDAAIDRMREAVETGYDEFSAADVAFHDAVARASRNKLIQISTEVVRSIVLDLISGRIAEADDRVALMRQSIRHHEEVLAAVRTGDGPLAARLSRRTMYDYYAGYVPAGERAALRALLE